MTSRDGPARDDAAPQGQRWPLISAMLAAIALVTGLAWWDEQREADAALTDLETEQTIVASSLAASLRAQLTNGRAVDRDVSPKDLLDPEHRIERTSELSVFLLAPGDTSLRATDGRRLFSPRLTDALAAGVPAVRLTRPEAADLGLPARTAMAGLEHVDAGPLGRWGVVAVATAARERDREKRAMGRLLLGVLLTSGFVVLFGGIALRKQRREFGLSRELAVTEAQRAGEDALAQAQRIATMGTFAMGIAHEVATPLGVIMGRAEQLVGRLHGDERSVRGAQTIMKQADRIEHVVRRFLDMARGGAPTFERANPADVARAAVAAVEHRFSKAGVELATDYPDELPDVQCDRALLEQALVNLLLNACDACEDGRGARSTERAQERRHVQVAARADAQHVAFVVTDDGAGITSEHAAMVTEPFFTTKPDGKGSGLGLSIATEIAKSHRGNLTIAPNAPRGTRACIEIPVAAQGAPHAKPE